MIDQYFTDPLARMRVQEGPLGSHIDGFAAHMEGLGYARKSILEKLYLASKLSRWLGAHSLEVSGLDEQRTRQFTCSLVEHRRPRRGDVATLRLLLAYLRSVGVVLSIPDRIPESAVDRQVRDYEHYLLHERGLSPASLSNYLCFARQFLDDRYGTSEIEYLRLTAGDVTGFIQRHAFKQSPKRASVMVAALRSFLRFLCFRGSLDVNLADCVPGVANWRFTVLPESLKSDEVELLLETTCDRETPTGRRDYAILLILARLGLRGGEVTRLKLEDINWEAGEIRVRGKGGRAARLPLPTDVGEALVAYLRAGRPRCSSRHVFIRAKAPLKGFPNSVAIADMVRRALRRAGLESRRGAAHLLRHAAATQMLRRGASLPEIGELLRHRHQDTTRIYAKVDLTALRQLARPWPEVRHE